MKKGQKHQNVMAFKLKYHQDKIDLKERTPLNNLCDRCHEILAWRLNFGKYKKMSQPAKCHSCGLCVVTRTYCAHCDRCSSARAVCA